jgi:subtilisin-like proprotein convertase family protein
LVVDAGSGDVLARSARTDYANSATVYETYPGAPVGGGAHSTDLDIYITDALGANGLKGPNAWAWSDTTDDCFVSSLTAVSLGCAGPGAAEDVTRSSVTGDFDFALTPFSPTSPPQFCPAAPACTWDSTVANSWNTNRQQNATQAFFFVNNFHDHLAAAPIGFDAASHNFETGDPVLVNTDDGAASNGGLTDSSHRNNANFSTPQDGVSPVMQMYLFRNSSFNSVNGGDDAIIVYHEYTHGLSNRLVGGGAGGGLSAFQSRSMGEAWSDWYAFDFLVAQSNLTDTAANGELNADLYVTPGSGHLIRTEPMDCPVGSTGPQCPGTATAGAGGYTFGDMGKVISQREVHADGEIWGQTLWDIRSAIGSADTEELVTDALRNSPIGPGFLDQRDQIIADAAVKFPGLVDTLWSIFAARGMGAGASATAADSSVVQEAFDLPDKVAGAGITVSDPAPGGDGDGRAEPGETVALTTTLFNPGPAAVSGLSGTLSSGTATVTAASSAFTPAALATAARATNATPFVATIPQTASCGGSVPFTVTAHTDQTAGTAVAFPLVINGAGTAVDAIKNESPALTVTDNNSNGVVSSIVRADGGAVGDVNVTINSVTHTFDGDLTFKLESPSGKVVRLVERLGGEGNSGDNMQNTVLDDSATGGIIGVPPRTAPNLAPYTGTFKPIEPLSTFNGEPISGTWKLHVYDLVAGDVGTLAQWTLTIAPQDCTTTPAVTTGDADGVTQTAATLHGNVNPRGTGTQYRFEFGTTDAYGSTTDTVDTGTGVADGVAPINGLNPSTTYHYRVVALRSGGVAAAGGDKTFTTNSVPAPPPPPPPPPTVTPVAGFSFTKSPKTLTLDSKGQFTWTFKALAGLKGTAVFDSATKVAARIDVTAAAKKKKILKLGSKSFTVDSKGAGKVKLKLSSSAFKSMKKLKTVKVKVTVTSTSPADKKATTFTLKAPKRK